MNFWNIKELRKIHVELTNACNAACPMCVRFYRNSPIVRPDLDLHQITIDKFKQYFPPEIIGQLDKIKFCGVHGDPGMAKDLYEICEYIDQHATTNCIVQIHTNGGMRKPEWWHRLGTLFSKRNHNAPWRIIFSVDGLEDTNHIYRRNVEWTKVVNNAQAFIDAGGVAVWEYLVFKHNEHQVEQARALSKQMGFKVFIPKGALGVDNGTDLVKMHARDREGNLDYVIEAPVQDTYRNLKNPKGEQPINFYPFQLEEFKNRDYSKEIDSAYDKILTEDLEKLNSCEVKCKMNVEEGAKELFVDNFGRVIACCYIGTHLNGQYDDFQSLQAHKHVKDYGWDKFDLNKHSLVDILEQGHLDRVYADSWTKPSVKEGKMAYCAFICGEESRIDRIYFK